MGLVIILSIVLVAALVAAIALYLFQPTDQTEITIEVEDQRAVVSLHGKVTIWIDAYSQGPAA